MPTARQMLAAVAAPDGKIYAIGGFTSLYNAVDTVEEYDPATDTWTSATPMLTARGYLGAATVGGNTYAIGGYDGVSLRDIVEAAVVAGCTPLPTPTPTPAMRTLTVVLSGDGSGTVTSLPEGIDCGTA